MNIESGDKNKAGQIIEETSITIKGVTYITTNEEIIFDDWVTDGWTVWQWKDSRSLLGVKKIKQ